MDAHRVQKLRSTGRGFRRNFRERLRGKVELNPIPRPGSIGELIFVSRVSDFGFQVSGFGFRVSGFS